MSHFETGEVRHCCVKCARNTLGAGRYLPLEFVCVSRECVSRIGLIRISRSESVHPNRFDCCESIGHIYLGCVISVHIHSTRGLRPGGRAGRRELRAGAVQLQTIHMHIEYAPVQTLIE